jgi:membrane protein YqaA with SNARE-associated domain
MLVPRHLHAAAALVAPLTTHVQHHHHQMSPTMAFFFHLGIAGLFLVALVDSSFVPLPIPGLTDILLIVYAANSENPVLLVAIAVAGAATGGLLSHAVGKAGGMAFLQKHVPERILGRVTQWAESHAILSIALPALLPPPMPLSPFVLVAGAICMKRSTFAWAFTLSRLARYSFSVWLGVHYGRQVLHLWNRFSARWGTTFLITLWVFILVFTGIAIWKLYQTSRATKPVASQAAAS